MTRKMALLVLIENLRRYAIINPDMNGASAFPRRYDNTLRLRCGDATSFYASR
jgi:hypothetical protein